MNFLDIKIVLAVVICGAIIETSYGAIIEVPSFFNIGMINTYLLTRNLSEPSDCKRACGGPRRICYKEFIVEHYAAMGVACGKCAQGVIEDCYKPQCVPADGYERGVVTINRQIPGPLIETCENDFIVIDVRNYLHSDSLSIHWHGILQRGTQYMDGVPYVTQCPINPMTSFRYAFATPEPGTYFYHSHSGIQRYSGVYGGLNVKPFINNTHTRLYDFDHHLMQLADWTHASAEDFMVGLPTKLPLLLPDALLINGRGKFLNNTVFTNSPYETFYVTRGSRYRFRIVNAGSTVCPMELQIQNHPMTIIATDASDTLPYTVNTLTLTTGERYDVIINANQTAGSMHWIHLKSIGICSDLRIFQTAVLSYKQNTGLLNDFPSSPRNFEGFAKGIVYNDLFAPCKTPGNVCVTNLKSVEGPNLWTRPADQKHYITFEIKPLNETTFFAKNNYHPFLNLFDNILVLGTMNNFAYVPQASPYISQLMNTNFDRLCSRFRTPSYCSRMEICQCNQVINVVQNGLIEIVLIDTTPAPAPVIHPIHMHGYTFSVLTEGHVLNETGGLTVDKVKRMEAQGLLRGDPNNAVLKDNLAIKNQGYAVIRFIANNPGPWFLHCHVEDHMIFGMALMMNVAGPLPIVPLNFPRCGNFP